MRSLPLLGAAAGLLCWVCPLASATSYTMLPVAKFGDTVSPTVQIKSQLIDPFPAFEIGTLNDAGQLCFVIENSHGGEALILYSNGTLIPVVSRLAPIAGLTEPGQWYQDVGVYSPVSMNQAGDLGFTADAELFLGAIQSYRVQVPFLWNAAAQKFSLVEPLSPDTFLIPQTTYDVGGMWLTVINNHDDVAYVTPFRSGGDFLSADFFRSHNGPLLKIAGPGDTMPDGSTIVDACNPSINDAGVVAFEAQRTIDPNHQNSAYLWVNGAVTRKIAVVGDPLPGGVRIASVLGVWVNNQNNKVLVSLITDAPRGGSNGLETPVSLYLWDNGVFTPVAVPGQTMPDGSKLVSVQDFGVSYANNLGQHAFLAILDDGSTAAYLMGADGKLSLIMKSSAPAGAGMTVRNVGQGEGTSSGIGLNDSGQVALTLQIDDDVDTVVLLTPNGP